MCWRYEDTESAERISLAQEPTNDSVEAAGDEGIVGVNDGKGTVRTGRSDTTGMLRHQKIDELEIGISSARKPAREAVLTGRPRDDHLHRCTAFRDLLFGHSNTGETGMASLLLQYTGSNGVFR